MAAFSYITRGINSQRATLGNRNHDRAEEWRDRYKDNVSAMEAVSARMIVIAERLAGREHMEETYREN